nr:hypothetical protein Iba_chr03dCG9010 [Ipomoea batatas]
MSLCSVVNLTSKSARFVHGFIWRISSVGKNPWHIRWVTQQFKLLAINGDTKSPLGDLDTSLDLHYEVPAGHWSLFGEGSLRLSGVESVMYYLGHPTLQAVTDYLCPWPIFLMTLRNSLGVGVHLVGGVHLGTKENCRKRKLRAAFRQLSDRLPPLASKWAGGRDELGQGGEVVVASVTTGLHDIDVSPVLEIGLRFGCHDILSLPCSSAVIVHPMC